MGVPSASMRFFWEAPYSLGVCVHSNPVPSLWVVESTNNHDRTWQNGSRRRRGRRPSDQLNLCLRIRNISMPFGWCPWHGGPASWPSRPQHLLHPGGTGLPLFSKKCCAPLFPFLQIPSFTCSMFWCVYSCVPFVWFPCSLVSFLLFPFLPGPSVSHCSIHFFWGMFLRRQFFFSSPFSLLTSFPSPCSAFPPFVIRRLHSVVCSWFFCPSQSSMELPETNVCLSLSIRVFVFRTRRICSNERSNYSPKW